MGAPAISGSAAYSAGTFTVTGAGTDVGESSDQFNFVYQLISGDATVVARLAAFDNAGPRAKAGVMVRESLAAGARHGFLHVTPSKGVAFSARTATGGGSETSAGGAGGAPVWLKPERRSSTLTAFRSSDGGTWSTIGTVTLSMASSVYAGLAVTSGHAPKSVTAAVTNVAVSSSGSQPPAVSLTSPSDGAVYSAPASIAMAATASDVDGKIARVDFYAGSTLLGSDASFPYTHTWTSVPAGTYVLTVVARDNGGLTTTSRASTIMVSASGTNRSRSVSLSSPADGTTYAAPAGIAKAATASDADGRIARVEFFVGSTFISSDPSSPYSVSWTNVPAGVYPLTAVARDNDGATTVSSARTITVTEPLVPETAVFTPSSNHDTAGTAMSWRFFRLAPIPPCPIRLPLRMSASPASWTASARQMSARPWRPSRPARTSPR